MIVIYTKERQKFKFVHEEDDRGEYYENVETTSTTPKKKMDEKETNLLGCRTITAAAAPLSV